MTAAKMFWYKFFIQDYQRDPSSERSSPGRTKATFTGAYLARLRKCTNLGPSAG